MCFVIIVASLPTFQHSMQLHPSLTLPDTNRHGRPSARPLDDENCCLAPTPPTGRRQQMERKRRTVMHRTNVKFKRHVRYNNVSSMRKADRSKMRPAIGDPVQKAPQEEFVSGPNVERQATGRKQLRCIETNRR